MLNSSFPGRFFPANSSVVSWYFVLTVNPGFRVASICGWEVFGVWEVGESCPHICFSPEDLFLDPSLLVSSLFSSSPPRLGAAAAGNVTTFESCPTHGPSLLLHWCLLTFSARQKSSLCLCLGTEETSHDDLGKVIVGGDKHTWTEIHLAICHLFLHYHSTCFKMLLKLKCMLEITLSSTAYWSPLQNAWWQSLRRCWEGENG